MTEQEWLAATDPLPMLAFLPTPGNERRLRLFAVACARRRWDAIDEFGRAAVEVAEAFADGAASADALRTARLTCRFAGESAAWYAAASRPEVAARNAALSAQTGDDAERTVQADLLRDIFGNPFRALPPLGDNVPKDAVELARAIYEERAFDRLPLLAERLAGADPALQRHCREPGPHVRGCWALDRVLHP